MSESGWISWTGGPCPVKEGEKFDAKWGDDDEHIYPNASAWEWPFFFDEEGAEFGAEGDPNATAYRISPAALST